MRRFLLVLFCFILICVLGGCTNTEKIEPVSTADLVDNSAGYRCTTLYFQTDDNFIVPVMKQIPWEEGIGQAALNQLIGTKANRNAAAAMGLKTIFPEDVTFSLSIDDAVATLNIHSLPELESANQERAMVITAVNTLTEFPSISKVRFLFDGEAVSALPHGTDVSAVMSPILLNTEPIETLSQGDIQWQPMTLYFPNQSASLNIPVTRYTAQEPSFAVSVAELIKGPVDSSLRNCFPENTTLISASIDQDIATVNFSSEFNCLQDDPALEQAAVETLQLAAKEYADIAQLNILVEGIPYQPTSQSTMATSLYANEFK